MILKCAIIDDEPLARDLIESYIEKTPFLELQGKYNSAITAFKELAHTPADIVFLDIQMPGLNGMDTAHMLPGNTRIVFTTAFPEYAVEAYRTNAIDYLLKPISYNNFLEAANKALHWYEICDMRSAKTTQDETNDEDNDNQNNDFIFVKSDYKLIRIDLKNITYIQGLKDYMQIFLVDTEKPIMTLISMKTIEERLPKSQFIRIHRSYIINKQHIKDIERNQIAIGNTLIPISEGYKNNIQRYIANHTI